MVYDLDTLKMPAPPLPAPTIQEQTPTMYVKKPMSRFSKQCIGSIFLIIFLFLVRISYPPWGSFLRELLTAEEVSPVEQAGHTMLIEIFSGTPVPEAFSAFCIEVSHASP